MPYGSVLTDTVQSSTAGTPPQFNDGNGTQVGTLCRAWVNFNGTTASPSTIRASFNVTSVTKSGTGSYTLNFTNALSDANYSVVGSSQDYIFATNGTFTTTTVPVQVYYLSSLGGGQTRIDEPYVTVAIFR